MDICLVIQSMKVQVLCDDPFRFRVKPFVIRFTKTEMIRSIETEIL